MGILDHVIAYCGHVRIHRRRKRKQMQTVEIMVKMCCEGCERTVKNSVSWMRGVKSVQVNRKESRFTVSGLVDRKKVLDAVLRTGKKAQFWPYIPYNVVYYPYAPQAYDRRAPPGYVNNVPEALPAPNARPEQYTWLFSDDNPNACSLM